MVNDIKYYDGSIQAIERIPMELKKRYSTAFEVEPKWLVDAASRRQKWIDQAQSLNLYIAGASGKKLDITYRMAWLRGLKTTYYLRALSATSTEKSTLEKGTLNAVDAQKIDSQATEPSAQMVDKPRQIQDASLGDQELGEAAAVPNQACDRGDGHRL